MKRLEDVWRAKIKEHKKLWAPVGRKRKTAVAHNSGPSVMERRRYKMMLDTLLGELPEDLKNIEPVADDVKVALLMEQLRKMRKGYSASLSEYRKTQRQLKEMAKVRQVVLENFPQVSCRLSSASRANT